MEEKLYDYICKRLSFSRERLNDCQFSFTYRNFWAGYVEALRDIEAYRNKLLCDETNKMLAEQEGQNHEEIS